MYSIIVKCGPNNDYLTLTYLNTSSAVIWKLKIKKYEQGGIFSVPQIFQNAFRDTKAKQIVRTLVQSKNYPIKQMAEL